MYIKGAAWSVHRGKKGQREQDLKDLHEDIIPPYAVSIEFYKDYKGILVTDGLVQYYLVDDKLPDVINTNYWAHATCDFSDAVKATDKTNPATVKEGKLKELFLFFI